MKEQDFTDWNEETEAALGAHKNPPGVPPEVSARVRARLLAEIAAPHTSTTTGESQPLKRPAEAVARGVQAGLGRMGQLAISFVAGAVAGASAHAWLSPGSTSRSPVVIETPSQERQPAPTRSTDTPLPTEMPRASPSAALESAPPSAASDLNAERALLDQAQRAFSRGDAAAALTSLNAHSRRFPRGRLEEEREALAVKALIGVGRNDEAKARGARFRARFAESIMLPSVDDALRTIR
jgi:hypothetical protein